MIKTKKLTPEQNSYLNDRLYPDFTSFPAEVSDLQDLLQDPFALTYPGSQSSVHGILQPLLLFHDIEEIWSLLWEVHHFGFA